MEITAQTINYILLITTLFGVVFGVWNRIQKPQTALDKRQALDNEEVDNKAKSLARELEIRNEEYNRRFSEVILANKEATITANNHINTIKTQIENLTTIMNSLNVEFRGSFTRLETIINERVPKK